MLIFALLIWQGSSAGAPPPPPLSLNSVLHHWSSRYGINPRVGGRPVFTRNSAGAFLTQEGELDTAVINTPRFDWATLNLPHGLTERRLVLTLEMARTNNAYPSSDLTSAAWTKTAASANLGAPDPAGGNAASTLTATGANGQAYSALAAGSSIARINSVWLRRRTGSGTIQVRDPADDSWVTVAITDKWVRYEVIHAAATPRAQGVKILTSGDAVDVYGFQNEDAAFKTSEIATVTGAVTRAADSFYWTYLHAPQTKMIYCRFVERGTINVAGGRVWLIGGATGVDPYLVVAVSGGFYSVTHKPTSILNVQSTLAVAPVLGDTVELVVILFFDGSVSIIQSINGAAVSSAGPSSAAALQAIWNDTRLWLNSEGTTGVGVAGFAELKLVEYADVVATTAQGRMDELRAFELGPNGDVL